MSKAATLLALAAALEQKDYQQAAAYLADHFVYYGTGTQSLSKSQFLELLQTLQSALPTLRFHLQHLCEMGNRVTAHLRFASLSVQSLATEDSPASQPGLGHGSKSDPLEAGLECTFEGAFITSLRVKAPPQQRTEDTLRALGAALHQS
ncbi:nuclear transport factor 2 family protein [Thermogemmatispora sp.]|uniref:nuclear transport factor 2 family protein n=1 Tax=Thermogemmatispora sp. TaxID=1968838 RepID=UPI001D5A1A20|nr:nuclear transport factor 2 family protein [Thermogemmatispora sp.]MBX5449749.1 nuclear transport factor 2 family protein [Thermogemmatispora sp.]